MRPTSTPTVFDRLTVSVWVTTASAAMLAAGAFLVGQRLLLLVRS